MIRVGSQHRRAVLVLGAGESGVAAARLLIADGMRAVVVDRAPADELGMSAAQITEVGAELWAGWDPNHVPEGPWSFAIVAPGIPPSSRWVTGLRLRGIPVVAELELGWRRCRARRTIAVSGSNGKSTAVRLIADALQLCGARVAVGGNGGPAACEIALKCGAPDALVLEVSSFQLETCGMFRPDVAVLLNVQPNHLDRHGTYEAYREIKTRLWGQQRPDDTVVLPVDQVAELCAVRAPRSRVVTFGTWTAADVRYSAGAIVQSSQLNASVRRTWFDNEVLGPTAAAAVAALSALGADPMAVERAARNFRPLPHRTAQVAEIQGVLYVNDSKATSCAAMMAALRMATRPVRLIAGGRAKEPTFAAARELLASRVRAAYLIGEAANLLASEWQDVVRCSVCGRLEAALERASREAVAGEMILLSPGCTSFDQYRNFEERGDVFEQWVRIRAAEAGQRKI